MQLLDVARRTGRVEHTGWRLRKDGSRFWGDVVITALHDDAGALTGFAKVTRDRTDVKSLEDAQDAFYAAFNHDFRTPVTALKGFVDAIRDAQDDDEREHLIERVEASADRLLGMVEGLVQFATHRAGTATLLLADIDIAQVVRGAVQNLPAHIGPGRVRVSDDVCHRPGERRRDAPGDDQPPGERAEVLPTGLSGVGRLLAARCGHGPTRDPRRGARASTPMTSTRSSTSSSGDVSRRTTVEAGSDSPACAS